MLAAITQARVIADHFLSMFIADTTFELIGRDGIASIFIKRIRVSGTPQLRAALVDDAHNAADRLTRKLLVQSSLFGIPSRASTTF